MDQMNGRECAYVKIEDDFGEESRLREASREKSSHWKPIHIPQKMQMKFEARICCTLLARSVHPSLETHCVYFCFTNSQISTLSPVETLHLLLLVLLEIALVRLDCSIATHPNLIAHPLN